jgi:hypothetical protein
VTCRARATDAASAHTTTTTEILKNLVSIGTFVTRVVKTEMAARGGSPLNVPIIHELAFEYYKRRAS